MIQGHAQDFNLGGGAHISFEEEGVGKKSVLNTAENEIRNNILLLPLREETGECPIVYPFH